MQPNNPDDPYGQQPPSYGQQPPPPPPPPSYGQPPSYEPPSYGPPSSGPPSYGPPSSGPPSSGPPSSGAPYGQPAYGQYGQPPVGKGPNNNLGLIALIVGIVSIVPLACCSILGIIAGATAAVLGWLGLQKANQGLATNRSQALAGMILGAIGFVISLASFILGLLNVFDTPGYGF